MALLPAPSAPGSDLTSFCALKALTPPMHSPSLPPALFTSYYETGKDSQEVAKTVERSPM